MSNFKSAHWTSAFQTHRRIAIDSIRLQAAVSDLTFNEKWKKVEQLSARSRVFALSLFGSLEGEYKSRCREKKSQDNACQKMVKKESEIMKDTEFITKLKKTGMLQKVQKAMKNRRRRCEAAKNDFTLFKSISHRSQYAVAICYTGFWAGFHAMFNQYVVDTDPKSFSTSEIKNLGKNLKIEYSRVSKNLSNLYAVLRKGNRELMLDTGMNILQSEEFNIPNLSSSCASICALTMASLNTALNVDSSKLGPLDLLAGKLARSWILLIVWALYVAHLSLLLEGDPKFQESVKAARNLSFRPKRTKAIAITPKTLSREGENFDGKYVRVTGFVKNMTTKRTRDGKFLNLFEAYELGDEEDTITVAVIFEHMGHRGLVNTSYVELFGIWKLTSPLSNTPVLQLERLNISHSAMRFGFNFVIKSVRPWFDYFPNSYNAHWSIRPQKKNRQASLEQMLTGAGELIVIKPFSSARREN